MHKKRTLLIILFISIIALGVTSYFAYQVKIKSPIIVIELGEPLSENPSDYLDGLDFAVARSEVNIDAIDQTKTGQGIVTISHAWQQLTCEVRIVDTTSPKIVERADTVYLAVDSKILPEQIYDQIIDNSDDVNVMVRAYGNITWSNVVVFNEIGRQSVQVQATDASGNVGIASIEVEVDTPPAISGVRDIYTVKGADFDYLDGITSYDDVDGDLTDGIVCDDSAVKLDAVGTYKLLYTSTDQYGLVGDVEASVVVFDDPMDLQDLINSHTISRTNQTIIGAYNIYDAGVLIDENISWALEVNLPTRVYLKSDYGSRGYAQASAFVIAVNDEDVILCTNKHVTDAFTTDTNSATFIEGEPVYNVEMLGDSGSNSGDLDIAFLRIKLADIPDEMQDKLRTVHIDKSYWDSLSNEPGLRAGVQSIDENQEIWFDETGYIKYKRRAVKYFESQGTMTELSFRVIGGTSGSAVIDGYGNLVAMVSRSTRQMQNGAWDTHYYAVPLDTILAEYERIVGGKVNYR